MIKKSLSTKMFFSVITNNLNWEVTSKRLDGVNDVKSIIGLHWKIQFSEGGSRKINKKGPFHKKRGGLG